MPGRWGPSPLRDVEMSRQWLPAGMQEGGERPRTKSTRNPFHNSTCPCAVSPCVCTVCGLLRRAPPASSHLGPGSGADNCLQLGIVALPRGRASKSGSYGRSKTVMSRQVQLHNGLLQNWSSIFPRKIPFCDCFSLQLTHSCL